MNDVLLGKIIDGDAQRDAIHIAVAPVISGRWQDDGLKPGDLIYLASTGLAEKAHDREYAHGIVDPFLTEPVQRGQKFWMVLFQKTITGIRHHWTHPAFQEPAGDSPSLAACKKAIAKIAVDNDMSYEKLMGYADLYLATKTISDHMNATEDLGGRLDEFWKCYEIIRGVAGSGEFIVCCY